MIKIADALTELISENPLLQFGLQHNLLNLSQTARYLEPLIETKVKKDITAAAITMALSRMQNETRKRKLQRDMYTIDRISMQTGLSTFTFAKTADAYARLRVLYASIQKASGFIVITQGTRQITVIVESKFAMRVKCVLSGRPLYSHKKVSSISASFDEKYLKIPGFIYIVLQQMMLLNINIIEVSSTFTELVLYIDEADLKIAFEALQVLFVKR